MLAANYSSPAYAIDIVLNALHTDATQLQQCWQALQAHTVGYVQVVILVNASVAQTLNLSCPAGWRVHWLYAPATDTAAEPLLSQALKHLQQAWLVHLQADYLVTPHWLTELLACAKQSERIAFVGAWSNRLGAQSLNQAAQPKLPLDFTPAQMAYRMRRSKPQINPSLPVLHPDCLLIRRCVLDAYPPEQAIATLQQQLETCQIQAQQAAWQSRLADAVYVYRNTPEVNALSITDAETQQNCADNRVLQALRRYYQHLIQRWHKVELGQYYWHERRVLIILPLRESSGGAHVLVCEAQIMRRMKIDVQLLNFHQHRAGWEAHYPDLEIPVLYVNGPEDVAAACMGFDAVIATAYFTVDWLLPLQDQPHAPRLGYYVQDFEPYFFIEKLTAKVPFFWRSAFLRRRLAGYYFRRHSEFRRAWLSYLQFPNMQLFTKTAWNQRELKTQVGRDSLVVGASYHSEKFLPRPQPATGNNAKPVRIVAMIRPSTARRSPALTMRVLRRIEQQYGGRVDICIFGANHDDPAYLALPRDFNFRQHNVLPSEHVADVLSWSDIFVDFSQFQAMGLTGLEAMACGAAVILPNIGGADSFARHQENALLVNTRNETACLRALQRLIDEPVLRQRLAQQGLQDVVQYAPEYAAFRLLDALFGHEVESFREKK